MPYPRQYSGEKRVHIFLDFRLLQRVYPVAKKHNVARSTVAGIVGEFVKGGFSAKPRLDMSPQLLSKIQEMHIKDLLSSLSSLEPFTVRGPKDNMLGGLGAKQVLEGALLQSDRNLLRKRESLAWHLKGTDEAALIGEVSKAIEDYDNRCLSIWQDIRRSLEESTGLGVRFERQKEGPILFPALVDVLYWIAVAPRGRGTSPEVGIVWYSLGEGPSALSAVVRYGFEEPAMLGDRVQVAFGDKSPMGRVQNAVDGFLKTELVDIAAKAAGDLTLVYHDLVYASGVLREAIKDVPEDELRKRICPECPYPEAILGAGQHISKKRRAKG